MPSQENPLLSAHKCTADGCRLPLPHLYSCVCKGRKRVLTSAPTHAAGALFPGKASQ